MSKNLDSRALEPWAEKLVEATTRLERDRSLCEAALQVEGVRAAGVWRDLLVAGEANLSLTSQAGEWDRLPNSDQVRALVERQLGPDALSQVHILGNSFTRETPILGLVGEGIASGSLDALEAILTLARTLEEGSSESAIDSIRSLFGDLPPD